MYLLNFYTFFLFLKKKNKKFIYYSFLIFQFFFFLIFKVYQTYFRFYDKYYSKMLNVNTALSININNRTIKYIYIYFNQINNNLFSFYIKLINFLILMSIILIYIFYKIKNIHMKNNYVTLNY